MSRFRPTMFAIAMTILSLIFATLTFAKQPQGKSPVPPRPKPGHGSSLGGKQVNGAVLNDITNDKELSGGITITHGGNPPRTGGGIVITHGGNPPRSPGSNDYCDDSCHHEHDSCHRQYCDRDDHTCYGETFEPMHNVCIVLPGDTFETVSLREYRTNSNAGSIANFNKLSLNAALVPGQILMLP
jgi:hypothetical protein